MRFQQRFASTVVDGVLGPLLSAAHLTVSLFLCNSVSNPQGEIRANERVLCQLTKVSAFSTYAQSRFASVVVDGVTGPLRLARHA